jgi:hypothetical protein
MTSKSKKKQIDFSVRPRANKQKLPPTADEWVQDGNESEKPTKHEEGPQKRLTLNVPTVLHTAFKSKCVLRGVTIQDRVCALIERDLAAAQETPEGKPDSD